MVSLVAAAALVVERRLPRPALLVALGGLVSAFATPAGPGLPLAVLRVGSRGSSIAEWAPPSFTSPAGIAGLVLLGAAVILLARSTGASVFDTVMVGLAALFAIYSLRTLPIAACVLVPVVAPHLQALVGPRVRAGRREQAVGVSLGLLVVAATLAVAPHTAQHPPAFAHDFDAELRTLPRGAPVLTVTQDGGPMMWTHPELDFPFHGYADVYADRELTTYADMFGLAPRWDRTLRRLGIRAALLPTEDAFTYALAHEGWTVLHRADDRELLVAPASR